MGSKAFLFLWLSLAIALMIASDVAARDLAETSKVVDDARYSGPGGYPGGGNGYPGGGNGYPGGGNNGGYHGGGYPPGRGYGRRSYAGEAVDAEPQQPKP